MMKQQINNKYIIMFAVILLQFVFAFPVSAQYDELPQIPELREEAQDNKYCNKRAEQYIGKQYVTDKNAIVKRQSLPDDMKVTPEEMKEFKDVLRVVREGDAITLEFNYERLTIQLDEYDFIIKAYCG